MQAFPLLAGAAVLGFSVQATEERQVPAPTFARDVAPIVHQRCASCHRSGEGAPFELLAYEDVRRRAKQVALVTRERIMPPWPPDRSNRFVEDRSLPEEEIEILQRWVESGCPEGDPAELPAPPVFPHGWQLGEPDAVAEMPETYTVPAEGGDIYRNFVIRAPVGELRHVRTVEWRPDNKRVVHHAVLYVDGSGTARAQDRADPFPGYEGMELGIPRIPDGQFVSWTPGKVPGPGQDGIAWRLDPETDLVLQLHLRPSGKPEPVRVSLGLHFADEPPTRRPMTIRLWSRDIDIPPGEPAYAVDASYELPVDVRVLVVYPHAHYLATDVTGTATLPDGTQKSLIHIPRWSFDWQQEYTYAEPLFLPRGTQVSIHYLYDNSADNPYNPSSPPRRVVHGYRSEDEMAELLLHVLPSPEDRPILWHDFVFTARSRDLAHYQELAALKPDEFGWNHELATYCLRVGRPGQAVEYYRELVELAPDRASPWQRLGQAQIANGELQAAVASLEKALEIEPTHARAHLHLGLARLELGEVERAEAELREVLRQVPLDPRANTHLAEILVQRGQRAEAARLFERALEGNPEHVRALTGLAEIALAEGRIEQALEHGEKALYVEPDDARAHHVLGSICEARGERSRARVHFEHAARFDPHEPRFQESLQRVRETEPRPGQ